MAQHGGKRAGAGKPRGKLSPKTLEKNAVQEAIRQRILKQADALFHAQLANAVGSIQVFRVDEEEREGKVRRIHTLVTDPAEIKAVLDEHDGGAGLVNESYYFVNQIAPDNRAIDSLLDRTFGKATQSIDLNGEMKLITKKAEDLTDDELAAAIK